MRKDTEKDFNREGIEKANEKLLYFQREYDDALNAYQGNREAFTRRWNQYKGSKEIAGGKPATMCWNFTFELIESQVDSFIPPPKVKPVNPTEKHIRNAAIIEDMIRNEIDRLPMEFLNDEDERTTKVMGGDLFMVEWDNGYKTHDTIGALSLRTVNATQFIPQKGVTDFHYMDKIFVEFEDTKTRIYDRYGKSVENEAVDPRTTEDTADKEDLATQVMCFYIKGGKLGCYSWVGDVELINDDDYEARKDKICSACGRTKQDGETRCVCGSEEFERRPMEYEKLLEDQVLSDGTIIPMKSYVKNDDGTYAFEEYEAPEIDVATGLQKMNYVFDENGMVVGSEPSIVVKQRAYMDYTKIPYYTPKKFPVCLRKNVSTYGEVLGDSDCDIISDFQTAANKILSKVNKKTVLAGSLLILPDTLNYNPSDEDVKPVYATAAQAAGITTRDLNYNVTNDINTVQQYYQMAKSCLGISDTYQGKADPTALSGTAKQAQIAQAAGRQKSKRVMKNACYADIYETMFKFMLAYADEPRIYTTTDQEGKPTQQIFNRYEFLEQDEFGNWYYDDEYLFSVDEAGATYSDRTFILNDVRDDFARGAFGNTADPSALMLYWREKEALNYPNAKRMVSYWQNKIEEQATLAQSQLQPKANTTTMNGGVENEML